MTEDRIDKRHKPKDLDQDTKDLDFGYNTQLFAANKANKVLTASNERLRNQLELTRYKLLVTVELLEAKRLNNAEAAWLARARRFLDDKSFLD